MRVYQLSYSDAHEGNVYDWFRTKREAEAEKKRLLKEWGDGCEEEIDISLVVLPKTVRGMVQWLRDNLSRDNG